MAFVRSNKNVDVTLSKEIADKLFQKTEKFNNTHTQPCRNGKKCTRKVCTFAHKEEELKPILCAFDFKCTNDMCKRKHTDQTMSEYISVNEWKFHDDEPVVEKVEPVVEKVESVVEKVEPVVEKVEPVVETDDSESESDCEEFVPPTDDNSDEELYENDDYAVLLEKLERHLDNVRMVTLEQSSVMYEFECYRRRILAEMDDISNETEVLNYIENDIEKTPVACHYAFLDFMNQTEKYENNKIETLRLFEMTYEDDEGVNFD